MAKVVAGCVSGVSASITGVLFSICPNITFTGSPSALRFRSAVIGCRGQKKAATAPRYEALGANRSRPFAATAAELLRMPRFGIVYGGCHQRLRRVLVPAVRQLFSKAFSVRSAVRCLAFVTGGELLNALICSAPPAIAFSASAPENALLTAGDDHQSVRIFRVALPWQSRW